jgi:hypothetical protein
MYKSILAILLVGLLAAPIMAQPLGPIPPGGWGTDCTYWGYSEGFASACALHTSRVPEGPCDPFGWVVYDELTCDGQATGEVFMFLGSVELWVELYAQMTCENTNWQFHRISDGQGNEDIYFWVFGQVSSNSEINVCVSAGDDNPQMQLQFVENIFGDFEMNPGIALNYGYQTGSYQMGEYPPANLNEDLIIELVENDYFYGLRQCFEVGPCDWWWILVGWGCIPYHAHDGYYLLVLTICPTPVM